jgi:hypothetical protein
MSPIGREFNATLADIRARSRKKAADAFMLEEEKVFYYND